MSEPLAELHMSIIRAAIDWRRTTVIGLPLPHCKTSHALAGAVDAYIAAMKRVAS